MPFPWSNRFLPPPFEDLQDETQRQIAADILNEEYQQRIAEGASPEEATAGALRAAAARLMATGDLGAGAEALLPDEARSVAVGEAGPGREPKVVIKVFGAGAGPFTAERLAALGSIPEEVREDAADLANAVREQAMADGKTPEEAAELALTAAMDLAAEATGTKPPNPPPSSRPPVDSIAMGAGWHAFETGQDGAITSCYFRATADDGTGRTIEYRGTTYIRGPYQPILAAGEHFRGRGRKVTVTREHLGQMARNALREQTLLPINFAHQGDRDIVNGRALGLFVHTSLRVIGDTLFARTAYTKRAAEMVRAGELPGISAEFSLNTTSKKTPDDKGDAKSIGAVLFGAGLLTDPQLDDLRVITKFGVNPQPELPGVSDNATPNVSENRTPGLTLHKNGADNPPSIGIRQTSGDTMADIKFHADTLTALNLSKGDTPEQFDAAVKAQADKLIAFESQVATLTEERDKAQAEVEQFKADADKARKETEAAKATLEDKDQEVVKLSGRVEVLEKDVEERKAEARKAEARDKVRAIADKRNVVFSEKQMDQGVTMFLAKLDDAANEYLGSIGLQRSPAGTPGETPEKEKLGNPQQEWVKFVEEKHDGDDQAALATDEGLTLFNRFQDSITRTTTVPVTA